MDWLTDYTRYQENIAKTLAFEYEYNQRQLVFQYNFTKLYHYQPTTKPVHSVPVLVVFATVNKAEVLDLMPDHSFIRGLLDQGLDVYMLDWGEVPVGMEIGFADYVDEYLKKTLHFIKESNQVEKIDVVGICQGGLISLCYAALNDDIHKLTLISTPVDFHAGSNAVSNILNHMDWSADVVRHGRIPGEWLTNFFISLRPFELLGTKYINYTKNIANEAFTDKFIRMEKWLHDAPSQPAKAFTEFVTEFYQQNKLIKGQYQVNGTVVELSNVQMPTLTITADNDVIIPPQSSTALAQYVAAERYTHANFNSGHIGVYVSDKVVSHLTNTIGNWLKQ